MTKHWFHSYLLEHYSEGKSLGLDIGCAMRPYHTDYRCNYIGLDLPSRPYEKLKPDIFSEASYLPFKDNSFDIVVSYAVIPLIENIDRALDEMYRVLNQDGVLLIIIMNLRGLSLHPKMHFPNRYNSKTLNQKLREHKFRSIMKKNIRALLWATYFDLTSVYDYAVMKPIKKI